MRHERGWREKVAARTARRLQANVRRAAEEATNVAGPEHLAPQPAPGLEFDARGVLVPIVYEPGEKEMVREFRKLLKP